MAGRRRRAAFVIALGCGAAIWLLSPLVTGRAEPWDAAGWYYTGALFLAGCAVATLFPAHLGVVAIGIVAGQILVLLGRVATNSSGSGLWPLGILFLVGYGMVPLLGAALGAAAGRLRQRNHPPDAA